MKKNIIFGIIILALVVIGAWQLTSGPARLPVGAIAGPDWGSYFTVGGLFTANGGVLESSTIATSTTVTTQTLAQTDLMDTNTGRTYSSVLFTPNKGSVTLTLPATSTLTRFVPSAGDMANQCWYNATSTAAINIVFAAGAGIDLQVATSTGSTGGAFDLTVAKGGMGCLKFLRQTDTDISVGLTEYEDAD